MKKILPLLLLLVFSCNKEDDNDPDNKTVVPTLNITVFSTDFFTQEITEMDVTTNGGGVNTSNLTQALGLPPGAVRTTSGNTTLTWYERNTNFEVWQKDILSGQTFTYSAPCDIGQEVPWRAHNSVDHVFFETFAENASNLYVFDGQNCVSSLLDGYRIRNTYAYGNVVLVYALDRATGDMSKIFKVNTNTGQLIDELALANTAKVTVRDNELHV
ncbi:MAG: hypothetical protein AAF466_14545, partial [Bacteroidota bacterium]